jgi:hypothetical protein
MKTYIKPSTSIVVIETVHMIAASGDTRNVSISETEYDGTFNARRGGSSWGDDDE